MIETGVGQDPERITRCPGPTPRGPNVLNTDGEQTRMSLSFWLYKESCLSLPGSRPGDACSHPASLHQGTAPSSFLQRTHAHTLCRHVHAHTHPHAHRHTANARTHTHSQCTCTHTALHTHAHTHTRARACTCMHLLIPEAQTSGDPSPLSHLTVDRAG